MTSINPYDSTVEVAHVRAGTITSDVAIAARDYYRVLTDAELRELVDEIVRIFVELDRNEIWLTANEVLTLCATHSHS